MWDQRYSADTYVYGTEPNDFLRLNAQRLPIGRTLCIGEGEGRNAVFLAGLGHDVTALDASHVGLAKARKLADRKGVHIETLHADLSEFVFEAERWDVIVSIFCHLPEPLRISVHKDVSMALRKDGVFILEAYTPDQLQYKTGGPPSEDMMMDLDGLRQELKGLELIHAEETVREIHEGSFHSGAGAVVQILATRPDSI